jgi:hypothetical protein
MSLINFPNLIRNHQAETLKVFTPEILEATYEPITKCIEIYTVKNGKRYAGVGHIDLNLELNDINIGKQLSSQILNLIASAYRQGRIPQNNLIRDTLSY